MGGEQGRCEPGGAASVRQRAGPVVAGRHRRQIVGGLRLTERGVQGAIGFLVFHTGSPPNIPVRANEYRAVSLDPVCDVPRVIGVGEFATLADHVGDKLGPGRRGKLARRLRVVPRAKGSQRQRGLEQVAGRTGAQKS